MFKVYHLWKEKKMNEFHLGFFLHTGLNQKKKYLQSYEMLLIQVTCFHVYVTKITMVDQ